MTLTTTPTPTPTGPRPGRAAVAVLRPWGLALAAWGLTVGVLSATGVLTAVPLLLLPTLIAAGIAVPLIAVRFSPETRRFVREVDIAHLTWFNVWRVPAALVFFAVGAQGLLPPQFVANAAWGDFVAGVLAAVVVVVGLRLRGVARWRAYLGFHVFSFGDFVVAVGTGLFFTLTGNELMRTLLDTPMALIPLWGVPITGAISLLALNRLIRHRK